MLRAALVLASLVAGDTISYTSAINTQGRSSVTLTGPDFCRTTQCVSDAGGGGGGGGVSNPYLGTFVADAGSFNALCLTDGGCISSFPGQVITGVDGGNLANTTLSYHCEIGRGLGSSSNIQMAHSCKTSWGWCDCYDTTALPPSRRCSCSLVADGGLLHFGSALSDGYNYMVCCL